MDNTPIGTNAMPLPPGPTPAQVERSFRSHNNFTGGGLLLYITLFIGLQIAAEVVAAIVMVLKDPGLASFERFKEYYNNIMDFSTNGWIYIATLSIGIFALFIFFRKRLPARDIFVSPRKMTGKAFLILFFVFYAGQFLGQLVCIIGEAGLNLLGLSNEIVEELMTEILSRPTMILYAAIVGPVAEELVFRGFLMRRFQAWGKVFAIVMSSVLFGLFHMNFVQIPYAIIVGIVLAYTAMEYGIKWSILFHIINNSILSYGIIFLSKTDAVGEKIAGYIELGFFAVCFVIALFFIIKYFGDIIEYIKQNRTEKHRYLWCFTTPTILIFTLISVGMAVMALLAIDPTDLMLLE